MKRNKITLAVLIVLFVCQFAFASAFQSAGSAGTAAVVQHATAYDALKVLAESQWNKFDYFMSVASASDAKIEAIIAECGITENPEDGSGNTRCPLPVRNRGNFSGQCFQENSSPARLVLQEERSYCSIQCTVQRSRLRVRS